MCKGLSSLLAENVLLIESPAYTDKMEPKLGKTCAIKFLGSSEELLTIGLNVTLWVNGGLSRTATVKPFAHPSYTDISLDGSRVLVKNTVGKIVVLDASTLETLTKTTKLRRDEGCQALFSQDGDYIVNGTWSGELSCLSTNSLLPFHSEAHPKTMILGLTCSKQRNRYAYVKQPIAVGDAPPAASVVCLREWPFWNSAEKIIAYRNGVHEVSLSPDGSKILVVHTDQAGNEHIDLLNVKEDRVLANASFRFSGVAPSLTWSPNGKYIANTQPNQIAIRNSTDLSIYATYDIPFPSWVEFSPDGKSIAIGSWEQGTVKSLSSLTSKSK
jgi:WD40 repeat protein